MLARYCHRWRIMAFGEATHSVVASAFGRLTTKDLPLLETIHSNGNVFFWQDSDTDDTNPIGLSVIGSLLGRASSLRALHLTGEYFSEQSLLSDLPLLWSRLTELCITPPSGHYYDCYKLLQLLAKECHSLASLDLVSQGVHLVQERGERRSSPVEWSSIRKFAISFIGSAVDRRPLELVFTRQVVEAFESVVLPSLKEFSVDLPGYHDLFPPPPSKISSTPWEQLLLRSQPAITHIQLSFPTSLEATAVFKSLQSLDTPKSLRFGCGNSRQIADEQFLPAFLEAGASLCPELEEVEFGKCGSAAAKSLLELAVIRPNLKVIRAHFFVSEDEVETLLPSAQVVHELKVTMNEREGTLQGYVKGVRLIWTWKSQDDPSRDAHTDGMPGDTLYW
ncbi:hypothetical protein V5O48_011239 [Marasmius crinis-equi]|uniref:Uncharacterized protein n=1 Tax=Marasmius crinis-equi TaxID=585013 RepID=A0ABR3F655_9AGAR